MEVYGIRRFFEGGEEVSREVKEFVWEVIMFLWKYVVDTFSYDFVYWGCCLVIWN